MKVSELLLEKAPSGMHSPWAAKMGYDAEQKAVMGGVIAWLEKLNASAEDVAEAMKQAKRLPSYKTVTSLADDITTPKRKLNGTFAFEPDLKKMEPDFKKTIYLVHANGQL